MIEEKKNLEFTNEELIEFIHTQRKMMCMEEYYLIRKDLLDKVKRVLDLRDLVKITASNHKKTRKIINKYAKQSRKESDTKKLFKKQQVDLKRIAFRPAVELSYLSEENQYVVLNIFEFDEATPSLSQAIRLKKLEQEGNLTEEKIEEILGQEKSNQKEFIKIHNERIEINNLINNEINGLIKNDIKIVNATNNSSEEIINEYFSELIS